jgi:hypothetical protein
MIGSIRFCLVTLSLGLGTIATPAAASTITYNWYGIVEIDHYPGVTLSENIKISVTLNDAVPDTNPSPEIGQYDTQIWPPVLVVAASVGPSTAVGEFQTGTIFNDHNGIDAFSIGTGSLHIGNVLSFNFSTSNLSALTSDALPLSLNPDDFDVATFSVLGYGGPEGPVGFSGRVVLAPTPLPGSVGMLISALAGLVGAGWYKSRSLRTTALCA